MTTRKDFDKILIKAHSPWGQSKINCLLSILYGATINRQLNVDSVCAKRETIMSHIKYLRIYSDSGGCSHFEIKTIDLRTKNYAPPAPPLKTSVLEPANNSVFLELPVGWHGEWHPTPVRQWLIIMTGECEFEAGDGERTIRNTGDVILLDDTSGKGHQTKVLGNVAVRIAAIHFS